MKAYYIKKEQIDNIREVINALIEGLESFHVQLNLLEEKQGVELE